MILDFSKIFALLALAAVDSVENATVCDGVVAPDSPCAHLKVHIAAMNDAVCNDPVVIGSCTTAPTDKITMPPCLSGCEPKENKEFGAECKKDCFAQQMTQDNATNCYKACSLCTGTDVKTDSCEVLGTQGTAMKDAGMCTKPDYEQCTIGQNIDTLPECLKCDDQGDQKFDEGCKKDCFVNRKDKEAQDKACYQKCSLCIGTNKQKESCGVLETQGKAMKDAGMCATPVYGTCTTGEKLETLPQCLKCDDTEDQKEFDDKCKKSCFAQKQGKACYETCSLCTEDSNEASCPALKTQAQAMKGVCRDDPDFKLCWKNVDIDGEKPSCLKCEPKKNMKFEENCLNTCFKKYKNDTDEAAATKCYNDCYTKCTADSSVTACKVLKTEVVAMKGVCKVEPQFTNCRTNADISTIPGCLECDPKDGKQFKEGCMNSCFQNSPDKPSGSRMRREVTHGQDCYEKCPEDVTTTTKKPSGVDPAVVAPVVPSNNQTLGNNSTAAPKPNAPNSNNSTGADAAIHVGQTLSLARMIFTALALVMAVKVIAA